MGEAPAVDHEAWMAHGPRTEEQRVRYAAWRRRTMESLRTLGEAKASTRAEELLDMTIEEALRQFRMLVPQRDSVMWRLREEPSASTIALRDVLGRRRQKASASSRAGNE